MNLVLAVMIAAGVLAPGDVPELKSMPWLSDGRPDKDGAEWYLEDPAPRFETTFVLPENASVASKVKGLWFASPCPAYIRLNGAAVGGRRRSPVFPLWTAFDKTVYAERLDFDVADLLAAPQTNTLSVTIGNGWYNMPPLTFWGHRLFRNVLAHARPCFKLAVDGVGPLSWTWRESDLVQNSIHLGATVDRTRAADTVPKRAVLSPGPKGRVVPRTAPPVERQDMLVGQVRWLVQGSVALVDFGENATGIPTFVFPKTTKGQKIEIVYGERLAKDDFVNVLTQTAGQIKRGNGGPGAPRIAAQRDELICRGGAEERFSPPFSWHICRYAEIRSIATLPKLAVLEKFASSVRPIEPGASYLPSDERLLKLHQMCQKTFLANLVSVQSDCPGRERLGYGGDIAATCEAFMLNWDMREFYLKTLQDFADEAADDGFITETAPYVGIAVKGFGGRSGPMSWAVGVPVVMDALLRHYDERRALRFYPVCTRYIALVDERCPDGIIPHDIGDHEALQRAPDDVTATVHWYQFVTLTAKFAQLLGHADEASRYRRIADKIAGAFQARYVKNGIVANGTQSAQAMALYMGLVPAEDVPAAEARLVQAIEEKGFGPTTGIFSTRYMLVYLSEHGMADLARKIVLHQGFPGWLNMLDNGATTLWETWKESDNVYSNCHPMFGSVDEWLLKWGR